MKSIAKLATRDKVCFGAERCTLGEGVLLVRLSVQLPPSFLLEGFHPKSAQPAVQVLSALAPFGQPDPSVADILQQERGAELAADSNYR